MPERSEYQPNNVENQQSPEFTSPTIGRLDDFDMNYFRSLEGNDGWIALGMDNCKNQQYFTVFSEGGDKLGIIGVYDTEEDQNITHTVVDPKYRGLGLAAQFKDYILEKLNLPYLTLTINADNVSSLRAAEKIPGVERVSTPEYEQEFRKIKFRKSRQ